MAILSALEPAPQPQVDAARTEAIAKSTAKVTQLIQAATTKAVIIPERPQAVFNTGLPDHRPNKSPGKMRSDWRRAPCVVQADGAAEINSEHQLAVESASGAIKHAIKCGELLAAKKTELPRGAFDSWVEEHCKFSRATAYNYIKASKSSSALDGSALRHLYSSGRESRPVQRRRVVKSHRPVKVALITKAATLVKTKVTSPTTDIPASTPAKAKVEKVAPEDAQLALVSTLNMLCARSPAGVAVGVAPEDRGVCINVASRTLMWLEEFKAALYKLDEVRP